jgi:hypothetical protein
MVIEFFGLHLLRSGLISGTSSFACSVRESPLQDFSDLEQPTLAANPYNRIIKKNASAHFLAERVEVCGAGGGSRLS